jgi:hypothetical protein
VTSGVRQQLLPNCQPAYAGYLAWRGVAALDSLSAEVQHHLADKGTLYKVHSLHSLIFVISSYQPAEVTAILLAGQMT